MRYLCVLGALALTGCATPIVDVQVRSNAPSVRVLERGRVIAAGRPPVKVKLPADQDHDLVIQADGYTEHTVRVESETSGLWVVNVVAGSILCPPVLLFVPIAISRGAHCTLDPLEVDATLVQQGAPVSPR